MEISAIGGGLSGGSATQALGGTATTAGIPSTTTLDGANLSMTVPAGLQSLIDALGDFTSAEILIALMLMAAANKDDDNSGGGAALGLLIGLAFASQMGVSGGVELNVSIPAPEGGNLGGQIDLTA